MRIHLCLGAAVLFGLGACESQAAYQHDHWTGYSVGPSMSRALLSYNPEKDGHYIDFQWRKKKDIEMTLRRHFFNHNPDNPFEYYDPSVYAPRPNQSLLPAPWTYIHVEGLVFGAATLALSPVFYPIPVDSIIGSFDDADRGGSEFVNGFGTAFRPGAQVTLSFIHDALGFPETQGDDWRH